VAVAALAVRGQDSGVPLIAVNGIELYYESRGTGAALVVLGGLGLDVSEMGTLTGPLAARFRVIAADNRGTGRSAKPPGPYSIEQIPGTNRSSPRSAPS
jgi:3-oxoadipate enol-lactonase